MPVTRRRLRLVCMLVLAAATFGFPVAALAQVP
jgi:hypothetical protein